jgi:hypothetical protein
MLVDCALNIYLSSYVTLDKKKYLWFYYCLYESPISLPENSKLKKLKLRSAARAIRLSGSTRGLLLSL